MNDAFFHKTRIAPTPSGYLHIGNAMSFLMTAVLAKNVGAKLLLRIDDIDKERARRDYVEDIFETLRFLHIEWEEGPKDYDDFRKHYSQWRRMGLYKKALQQLREEEKVFACACSRKEQALSECHCFSKQIPLDTSNTSWRLITHTALLLTIKSIDGETVTTGLPPAMQSFIVRKKDGAPSYQLTSLIDDEYFAVDAIVRGEDLWNSTLAQQYLAAALGKAFFRDVLFYHHPLLTDNNGKLSKSAGAVSVKRLRSEGKSRDDIIQLIKERMNLGHEIDNL